MPSVSTTSARRRVARAPEAIVHVHAAADVEQQRETHRTVVLLDRYHRMRCAVVNQFEVVAGERCHRTSLRIPHHGADCDQVDAALEGRTCRLGGRRLRAWMRAQAGDHCRQQHRRTCHAPENPAHAPSLIKPLARSANAFFLGFSGRFIRPPSAWPSVAVSSTSRAGSRVKTALLGSLPGKTGEKVE
jgi:hypothetical protein